MKKLDKKIQKLWIIYGLIYFVLGTIGMTVLNIFSIGEKYFIAVIVLDVIYLLLSIFLCFVLPILNYKMYSYSYDEKRIVIHHGVIFRSRIVVPVCQIQDLHLQQGPMMLLMKLGGVTISTAGSNYTINGLSLEDAKKMVDDLENHFQVRIEELKDEEI